MNRLFRLGPALSLLVILAVPCLATAQQAVAELEFAFHPRASITSSLGHGPATEASVQVVRGTAVLPLVLRTEKSLFAPMLSASRIGVAVRPVDPARSEPIEALYDLDLNLVLLRELSPRWDLTLVATPGIASDLRRVEADHLTLQGGAIANRTVRPDLGWGLGVMATRSFGELLVVPVAALRWDGDQGRADLLLPAHAELLWTPSPPIEAGIAADLNGNAHALGREGELRDAVVRFSVIKVGPTLRFHPVPALRVTVSGRASLARRLDIEGAAGEQIQDATLKRGVVFGIGVGWLLSGTSSSP